MNTRMHKKKFYLLVCISFAVAAIVYTGCKKKEDASPSNSNTTGGSAITLSPSSKTVDNNSGFFTIHVTSPAAWSVVSDQTWCTVGPTSGASGDSIFCYYSANSTTSNRTATITVTASGTSAATFTLTQQGIQVGYLCTGHGSTSYFPIAQNNYWAYHETGFPDISDTVKGTMVFGSYTYFQFEHPDPFGGSSSYKYYRVASNGDIYQYSTSATQEYLEVPANPVVNQKWLSIEGDTLKVMSLNASISTSLCSYTGCLQLNAYYPSGNFAKSLYYKRSIGLVYVSYGFGNDQLFSVRLN
jgi:hypothetical protein